MMGKTHVAVGIAASYMIMQPQTVPQFIAATVGGSIGGVMADIDVKIDRSNKYALKASIDALYGEILAAALSVCALASDFFLKSGIVEQILKNGYLSIIGAVLFVAMTIIGEMSQHRARTHSILFLILFSVSALLINNSIGCAFAVGYLSHLFIDLFNKSPIRLFYPAKNGICFKVCYADRLGNELLLVLGVCVIILYVFLRTLL